MSHPLSVTLGLPLEREYEAWIVRAIQDDLVARGLSAAIIAVSPFDEVDWPADSEIRAYDKLVGLQFKRPKVSATPSLYCHLHWSLHQPRGQYGLVQRFPEIFYCLPTFLDRRLSTVPLHHTLFWRPSSSSGLQVWYDNPRAHSPHNKVSDAPRWGRFFESLVACDVGLRVSPDFSFRGFMRRVREAYGAHDTTVPESNAPESETPTPAVVHFVLSTLPTV